MHKIDVIVKRSNELYGHHCHISDSLSNLQKTVGGHIEMITVHKEHLPKELEATGDLIIICNEEGRLMDLPFNMVLFGYGLVGDIILTGADGDELANVPINYRNWKKFIGGNLL